MTLKVFRKALIALIVTGAILLGANPAAAADPANLVPVACYPTADGGSLNVYKDVNSGEFVAFLVE